MTPHFIRRLIIQTVYNVTGAPPGQFDACDRVDLDTRDWAQVFSRLEATLDIDSGMLISQERSFSISVMVLVLQERLTESTLS